MKKILLSLKKTDLKFYAALLLMGLCPAIYTTIRTFFLGQLPAEWSYSIAGQLSWINLIYEILNEAMILPLYFFMGEAYSNRREFTNRIRSGLSVVFLLYLICSLTIFVFVRPMLRFMAVTPEILDESAVYIRIECIANVFAILYQYLLVVLITIGRVKDVYLLTVIKLFLSIVSDTVLVSNYSFSLKLGVYGIGVGNVITNMLLLVAAGISIYRCGYPFLFADQLSFSWMKGFFRIGFVSGLESFVRNVAYMLMISRMVNMVGEQGTYWVANNFIWSWLLLPISQLGELIKKETGRNGNAVLENTPAYFFMTSMVCMLWLVLSPFYKPFIYHVLGYQDYDKLFRLVMLLLVSYLFYAFQNVCDATFYGRGKTKYLLYESLITNIFYYGIFFLFYLRGSWKPTLMGIALMFGGGNVFDSIVSLLMYRYYRRKMAKGRNEA